MDERKREQDDTQIKRQTDVRGSLGVPPSGSIEEESRTRDEIAETAERNRVRSHVVEDDDRMSERRRSALAEVTQRLLRLPTHRQRVHQCVRAQVLFATKTPCRNVVHRHDCRDHACGTVDAPLHDFLLAALAERLDGHGASSRPP